ncbi:hypothetical protein [Streptomyces sp. NPDC047706]|uniref:hypothetical protein n=1 Tax=Streptomyces sp. NPDC047706 TaxID=3365486 RepID=UPI0037132FF5
MTWIPAGLLITAAAFLLLFGEYIADRIDARRTAAAEQAWRDLVDARIRAERDPARRAAWRMIRNDRLGDL